MVSNMYSFKEWWAFNSVAEKATILITNNDPKSVMIVIIRNNYKPSETKGKKYCFGILKTNFLAMTGCTCAPICT